MAHSKDSPNPPQEVALSREPFIPIRNAQLPHMLLAGGDHGLDEPRFRHFCQILSATLHDEFHHTLQKLKYFYGEYDPDSALQRFSVAHPETRQSSCPRLFDEFDELLEKAHFHRLRADEIHAAAQAASDWGVRLRVDFSAFERLTVYARGDVLGRRLRRNWKKWFRQEEVDVPLYQKLVVIFKLKPGAEAGEMLDDDSIHLKLFKNIPKQDIDMLLPTSKIGMTWFDRSKILIPTLSGLSLTVFKLVTLWLGVIALTLAKFLALLGLVGGSLGYGFKSFMGFVRTRDKYHLTLTRSLYYQNLDNNMGVMLRLLDEAESQEYREGLLAYWFLLVHDHPRGLTAQEVDQRVEQWLQAELGVPVDFDVHDGLKKLARWDLILRQPEDRWRALPLDAAVDKLDQRWDQRRWDAPEAFSAPLPSPHAQPLLEPEREPLGRPDDVR